MVLRSGATIAPPCTKGRLGGFNPHRVPIRGTEEGHVCSKVRPGIEIDRRDASRTSPRLTHMAVIGAELSEASIRSRCKGAR